MHKPLRQLRGKTLWSTFATFIDAEGCIRIQRSVRKNKNSVYSAEIRIVNTCQEWLHAWQAMTGWGRVSNPVQIDPKHKPRVTWTISKVHELKHIFPNIIPFLYVKPKQAEICLDFLHNKKRIPHRLRLWQKPTEQELAWRDDMYQKIRLLNRKGSVPVETARRTSLEDGDTVRTVELSTEQSRNDFAASVPTEVVTNLHKSKLVETCPYFGQ